MKPPVNQKPVEQKSDSKLSSLNGKSGLELRPVLKAGLRRGRGRTKRQGRRKNLSLPPMLECSPVLGAWFRFDVTATVTGSTVTKNHLMAVPGCIGVTINALGYTLASAVRLKRIRAWPAAGGEVTLQWNGSAGKQRDESKDVTLPTGITVDRMVELSPPPGSYAAMWWEAAETTQSLLMINATQGAIIDVLLDYTLANTLGNLGVTFASISVGQMVYTYLDGNGSHQLKPLGRVTSF